MKAVVYDPRIPGRLALREAENPVPADDEVLIRVHACSVNAADYRSIRLGIVPKRRIYGADISGTVTAVGRNIATIAVGDEVLGDLAMFGFGGFAEYTVAPEHLLAKKPPSVSFEAAATVSLAGVTALQALRLGGEIRQGQSVLVLGAGGGVGTYCVQLAKHFGARVTAVCGAQNVEQMRALGANRVIDYAREDCLAQGERYDRILAVNGKRTLRDYHRALNRGGTAVIVGGALSQVFGTMAFGFLYTSGLRSLRVLAAKANAQDSAYLVQLIADGSIAPVIERIVPLEQAVEAFHLVAAGHARGKTVVKIV